jgi:hypothetical protein
MASQAYIKLLKEADVFEPFLIESRKQYIKEFAFNWRTLQHAYVSKADKSTKLGCYHYCFAFTYHMLERFEGKSILQEMIDLHVRKNAGYTGDHDDPWHNFRECEKFGISASDGIVARLSDKYMRFMSVISDPSKDQVNESALDTLRDYVAYLGILYCLEKE